MNKAEFECLTCGELWTVSLTARQCCIQEADRDYIHKDCDTCGFAVWDTKTWRMWKCNYGPEWIYKAQAFDLWLRRDGSCPNWKKNRRGFGQAI